MLKYSPILLLALLAACAAEPVPTITSGVQLTKSREVLVKGVVGSSEPYIQKRTYPVTCAADNQGGTPDQRADQMMAAAAKMVGQVDSTQVGLRYLQSSEARGINTYATPQYRCSVGMFTPSVVTKDPTAVVRWALTHGAMDEAMNGR